MSDRDDQDTKLLAGAFHDDWANGPAAVFARVAAAHARRRRTVQRILTTGAVAIVVAFATLFVSQSVKPLPERTLTQPTTAARGYEIISDDELLSQLHGRPVLAVKRADGTKQIVLLEAPPEISPHGE